jgi:hypothetical protein
MFGCVANRQPSFLEGEVERSGFLDIGYRPDKVPPVKMSVAGRVRTTQYGGCRAEMCFHQGPSQDVQELRQRGKDPSLRQIGIREVSTGWYRRMRLGGEEVVVLRLGRGVVGAGCGEYAVGGYERGRGK